MFASRLAATWLAEDPERRHRRLTGCLMSADLSGFTAMSERFASEGRRGAELLTEVVNASFTTLIDAAAREGGDVLKFGGDALLIWFEGEEAAVPAARAGARMQQALAAPRFVKAGLKMSVGVHFDAFDFFLVGEPDWRELVLVGAPVTRTVELESSAQPGQVLVSKDMAGLLPKEWHGRRTMSGIPLALDDVPRPKRPIPDFVVPPTDALVAPNLREDVHALAPLGGEHRFATIAFLEVEGIDHTLATYGPEALTGRLDDLIRATQGISRQYGLQFLYTDVIGDGLKLITTAGAPTTTANDEDSVLRYALDFVSGDPYGKLKCGVNRGRVFAGFLGSETRRTYTVMGDPVNLAARLMAHAKPGQVVATTETLESSRSEFATKELPPFLVKGKTHPVTAVVVEGIGEGRRAEPALTNLPLVGREHEVALLGGWVAEMADGRGRAVEIIGDAGVGKSRLIAEVADDDRIFLQVSVECQPYDTNTAYAAAKVILRRLLGIRYSASAEDAGLALFRTVSRASPGLLPLLPLLAVPIDAVVERTPEVDAIAQDFVLARTHDAVVDLLTAMVITPTLLLVEDAYYADSASAALFSALAQRIADRPWMLVASSRPETGYLLADGGPVERVMLAALPAAAAAELAAAALKGAPGISIELASAASRAEGNPLFVLRLMEAIRAGVAAEDLPESVERVVAERLDRLAPIDRTMLRYAAVLGSRFDADLLGLVLASTGQPTPDSAAWRRLADLIETEGGTVRRFRHVLYRDVAYEGLPFARRGRLHQRIGELLEASRYATDVALLAEHFFRAGDHERTWRYSVQAGDRAWAALAVAEAASAYERALKVRRRVRGLTPGIIARVSEGLGDVKERTAAYDEADGAYRAAARILAGDVVAGSRLLRKRGVLRERAGKYAAALRWYDRAELLLADADKSWLDAQVLVAIAGICYRQGRNQDQISYASRAADHAALGKDRETEAHACMLIHSGRSLAGERHDAGYGARALLLFTELGNVLYQGKVLNNLGIESYFSGDWIAAADHYAEAARRFEAAGDVVEAAIASNNLGEILSDQGHLENARALFERAVVAGTRANYPLVQAGAASNIGRAEARAGEIADALRTLHGARQELAALKASQFVVESDLRIIEAYLLGGETAAAEELLEATAEAVANGSGFPDAAATVVRLRCWCLRQRGRAEEAIVEAREGARLAESTGARFERALCLQQLAELTADGPSADEAAAELTALGVVRLPALPVPL